MPPLQYSVTWRAAWSLGAKFMLPTGRQDAGESEPHGAQLAFAFSASVEEKVAGHGIRPRRAAWSLGAEFMLPTGRQDAGESEPHGAQLAFAFSASVEEKVAGHGIRPQSDCT